MSNQVVTQPYEILLRYNCEKGEVAGHLRGVSLEQRSFLVDDKGVIVARIDSGRDDLPKDFPPEELQKLLGENFVAFEAQLTAAREATQIAKAALTTKQQAHTDLATTCKEIIERLTGALKPKDA